MYKIRQHHLDFIKQFEGFSPNKYICPAGLPTIGFGHVLLSGEEHQELSYQEGEALLLKDLKKVRYSILRNIITNLNDQQFTAILSFTFNLGGGALQRSTLRQKINAQLHHEVPNELARWVWAGGRKLPGLIKRRTIEGLHYCL